MEGLVDVALVIDADRTGLAILRRSSAPNSGLVLPELGDMGITLRLDLLNCFGSGKAIGSRHRRSRIIIVPTFHSGILWSLLRGHILSVRYRADHDERGEREQNSVHMSFPREFAH